MIKKIFGFDLGIASIGWAVINLDDEMIDGNTGEVFEGVVSGNIVDAGVRTFPVAENAKDGSSLAKPRREARLSRRVISRRAKRKKDIRNLFVKHRLIEAGKLNNIFEEQHKNGGDVWCLRVKGLSEKLTPNELVRVLFHLAKHRGFKSARKAEEKLDAEGGKVLNAIKNNLSAIEGNNKTLAQYLFEKQNTAFGSANSNRKIAIRNRQITVNNKTENSYQNSIPRSEVERELKLIYDKQKEFGYFTQELYDEFSEIAFQQLPISSIGDMVGNCIFESGEKRAPKESPSAELFVALSKINNFQVLENGIPRLLTSDERIALLSLLKEKRDVKYSTIRTNLFKEKDKQFFKFNEVNYSPKIKPKKITKGEELVADTTINTDEKKIKNPEDTKFYSMRGYHKLRNELDDNFLSYSNEMLDNIVTIMATEKADDNIIKALTKYNLPKKDIDNLLKLTFSKFINLSLKAIYKINPHLETGLLYSEACAKSNYDHTKTCDKFTDKKGDFLNPIKPEQLTAVPVVNRTVAQFRKLYNAIARSYGTPDQIIIETGKELRKSYDERRKIIEMQEENRQERENAEKQGANIEGFIAGNKKHILMKRLYEHQGGKCIYSGKAINLNQLYQAGYCEVDHILPRSRSHDDGFNNKVLCLREENQQKGNQTPYEWFGHNKEKWRDFTIRVDSINKFGFQKKSNLKCTDFKEREVEFKERNSNDNRYISRYICRYLEDSISFDNSKIKMPDNQRIQRRAGSITAYLRSQWGLTKNRGENDRHHAQDAIVIATSTPRVVNYISNIAGKFEDKWKYRDKDKAWYENLKKMIQNPWDGFRNDVAEKMDSIFISRSPRKKATGELHGATVYTMNERKKQYDASKLKSGLPLRGGHVSNGYMYRVDVFSKKNKHGKAEFYIVPIYLIDVAKGVMPNKAISNGKDGWVEIDETFTFKFSLFSDDLVKVVSKKEEYFGYYKSTDSSDGRINIETHDRSEIKTVKRSTDDELNLTDDTNDDKKKKKTQYRVSTKTADSIQKYTVDYLGKNIHEIKQEKRLPVENIWKKNKTGTDKEI